MSEILEINRDSEMVETEEQCHTLLAAVYRLLTGDEEEQITESSEDEEYV